jgi:hypothetical protein
MTNKNVNEALSILVVEVDDLTQRIVNLEKEVNHPSKSWPQKGDKYYCFDSLGETRRANWDDDIIDHKILEFLGVYRTEEEAVAMREKIRAFIKENQS